MSSSPFDIHYEITLASIAGHLFDVKMCIQHPDKSGQIVTLPAWIPGSYMVRDFAKHIISLSAETKSGKPLTSQKLDKQTWQIAPSDEALVIHYQLYANDLSVRAAYINDQFGFFNGSNVFLEGVGQSHLPASLAIKQQVFVANSYNIATTMPSLQTAAVDNNVHYYQAENYAELIDHPVLIGQFDRRVFSVNGVEFELVLAGGHQSDLHRICTDLSKICLQHFTLYADKSPVDRYLFMTMLTDSAFGGLEHRSSTALMYARHDLPSYREPASPSEGYRTFLSLCSHELLHTWHVKRIKPLELVHGTLQSESYTEQLWIYEGFTSYYDDLFLQRSKVISQQDYLLLIGQNLTRLQRNIGRLKQSVTASSFDAWTKFYKQDESAINNIVSYYNKGAIVALCLDLSIRLTSSHQLSLDDVMRHLWQHFGKTDIPTPKTVIHDILQSFGLELTTFLNDAIYSTNELPVAPLLKEFGVTLHNRQRIDNNDKGGMPAELMQTFDFGAQYKARDVGIEIVQVSQDSAAYQADLLVGDIVIAIGNWQVSATNLMSLLSKLNNNQTIKLHVLRDKRLVQLTFTVKPAPHDTIYLTIGDADKVSKWLE